MIDSYWFSFAICLIRTTEATTKNTLQVSVLRSLKLGSIGSAQRWQPWRQWRLCASHPPSFGPCLPPGAAVPPWAHWRQAWHLPWFLVQSCFAHGGGHWFFYDFLSFFLDGYSKLLEFWMVLRHSSSWNSWSWRHRQVWSAGSCKSSNTRPAHLQSWGQGGASGAGHQGPSVQDPTTALHQKYHDGTLQRPGPNWDSIAAVFFQRHWRKTLRYTMENMDWVEKRGFSKDDHLTEQQHLGPVVLGRRQWLSKTILYNSRFVGFLHATPKKCSHPHFFGWESPSPARKRQLSQDARQRLCRWPRLLPEDMQWVQHTAAQRFGPGAALGDPEDNVFIVSLARRPEKRSRVLRQLEENQLSLELCVFKGKENLWGINENTTRVAQHAFLIDPFLGSAKDGFASNSVGFDSGMPLWWMPWTEMVFSIKTTWRRWVFAFCLVTIQVSATTTCPTPLVRWDASSATMQCGTAWLSKISRQPWFWKMISTFKQTSKQD